MGKGHDCLIGNWNPPINYLTKISNLLFHFSTLKNGKKKKKKFTLKRKDLRLVNSKLR